MSAELKRRARFRLQAAVLALTSVICLLFLVVPQHIARASDITGADYTAIVRVTNNSTAATVVSVPVAGANTTNLIAANYLNASADNCAIQSAAGADVPFMPGYGLDPWCVFVASIGADTITDYSWYNAAPGGDINYFPGDGGMDVADNAALEPGDNFSVKMGRVMLSANNTVFSKGSDFVATYDDTTENITVSINNYYQPAGTISDPLANWTDDALAYDGNTGTKATDAMPVSPTTGDPLYMTPTATIATLARVRAWVSTSDPQSGDRFILQVLRTTDGGVWQTAIPDSAVATINQNNWKSWDIGPYSSVNNTRWISRRTVGGAANYFIHEVEYSSGDLKLVATGIDQDEHDIEVTADSTYYRLYMDGIESDNETIVVGVVDNSDNWSFGDDNATAYFNYASISIGGVETANWTWNYGATFTDGTGNGYDATPVFRGISSDPHVSAAFLSFRPVSEALAPAYAVSAPPDFVTGNITASGNFTTAGVTGSGFPGEDVIDAAATGAGVANIWLWGIIGIVTIALAGLGVSALERYWGGGAGTIFIRLGIAVIVMGVMVTLDIYDFWMLVMYLFIALAPALASMARDIAPAHGQLNLIGFLATVWIGLTTINRIQEGQLITSEETAHLNTLMFTQEFTLLDVFHVPIINFEFFSSGIPSLLKWDYSFFGGNAQLIQYFLYSLTAIVSFIVLILVFGVISSYFTRRA